MISRTTRVTLPLLLCAAAAALLAGSASADEGATLRKHLAAYDRAGGGNTIPIEQEILRLRSSGAADVLVEHLGHRRFGPTILWALTEMKRPPPVDKILEAYRGYSAQEQLQAARSLAALATDEARTALRELSSRKEWNEHGLAIVRGALLRARDPATEEWVKRSLESKDADEVAAALLAAGNGRVERMLPAAAKLLDDGRTLEKSVRSRYKISVRKELPNGGVQISSRYPDLKTVGEVALEAANRMVAPTTPEYIAWWYELEKDKRFDGAEKLRRYIAADRKAAKAKAPSATQAIAVVLAHLREQNPKGAHVRIVEVRFRNKAWTIIFEIDGTETQRTVGLNGRLSG